MRKHQISAQPHGHTYLAQRTSAPIKVNDGGIISIFTGAPRGLHRSPNRLHEYLDFIGEIATNFGSQVSATWKHTTCTVALGRTTPTVAASKQHHSQHSCTMQGPFLAANPLESLLQPQPISHSLTHSFYGGTSSPAGRHASASILSAFAQDDANDARILILKWIPNYIVHTHSCQHIAAVHICANGTLFGICQSVCQKTDQPTNHLIIFFAGTEERESPLLLGSHRNQQLSNVVTAHWA